MTEEEIELFRILNNQIMCRENEISLLGKSDEELSCLLQEEIYEMMDLIERLTNKE